MPSFSISRNFKSELFNTEPCNRLREAAVIPGRSLQMGVDSEPKDDVSVRNLHGVLLNLVNFSANLPDKHLPKIPKNSREPPVWGPFFLENFEFSEGRFETTTFFAVKRFQKQAGLKDDGKAGAKTLRRLDEIQLHLETVVFNNE